MEPIPKLNRASHRRIVRPLLLVLFVASSVGLLQQRLAAIYARPGALPAIVARSSPRREDALLFDHALAAGLLRPGEDGRITIAPADLPLRQAYARANPELLAPRGGEPDWLNGFWDEDIRQIHRALHFSAAGRYVRQQIEAFNARQLLVAVRWRSASSLAGDWRADWVGAPLTLTGTMPPAIERLSAEIAGDWRPWRRVARWPALEGQQPVRFQLGWERPANGGDRLELLVVGRVPAVTGATVLADEPHCSPALPCAESEAVVRWLRLELPEGAAGLDLSVLPLPATAIPDHAHQELTHVQREGEQLVWRATPTGIAVDPARSPMQATSDEE